MLTYLFVVLPQRLDWDRRSRCFSQRSSVQEQTNEHYQSDLNSLLVCKQRSSRASLKEAIDEPDVQQSVCRGYIWPVSLYVAIKVISRVEAPDWIKCFRFKVHLWLNLDLRDAGVPNHLFHHDHYDHHHFNPPVPAASPFGSQFICQHPGPPILQESHHHFESWPTSLRHSQAKATLGSWSWGGALSAFTSWWRCFKSTERLPLLGHYVHLYQVFLTAVTGTHSPALDRLTKGVLLSWRLSKMCFFFF